MAASQGDAARLVRALSGPSGRVDGSKFILDEPRNRFVYPQDKSFVVYFEWDASPGQHVLTAIWKQPDGRIGSISPEVKIESSNRELKCYWTNLLSPGMTDGFWTVDVRVDGQPAGFHAFEIVGTEQAAPKSAPEPSTTSRSLDDIFRSTAASIVSVHKLDEEGRRWDTASGFIFGNKNHIATAFQAVDGATKLQVEFADGRTVETDELLAFSRTGDWALLKAETGDRPALVAGEPERVQIGERLIVFSREAGARIIGGVDISGRRDVPRYGQRIQVSPALTADDAGGPLLDKAGRVVGILGGALTPGTRRLGSTMNTSPDLWLSLSRQFAAVPVSVLPASVSENGVRLIQIATQGAMTPALSAMPELLYGGTAADLPKDAAATPTGASEFSRKDPQVWVFSMWQRRGKLSKGFISAKVYDEQNRVISNVAPKKTSLDTAPLRSAFGFAPASLNPGIYRIDLLWDGRPVWRTFIRVSE